MPPQPSTAPSHFHSFLPAGCRPAAGVCHHPEGRERSDPHGHHHGHRLPDLLGPLRQCCFLHLHQPGVGLRAHLHDHPGFLCQELRHLQPCDLHRNEQTGNWQDARRSPFFVFCFITACRELWHLEVPEGGLFLADLVPACRRVIVQLILNVA